MKCRTKWLTLFLCGALLFSGCSTAVESDPGKPDQTITEPTDSPVTPPTEEPAPSIPEEPTPFPEDTPAQPTETPDAAVTPSPLEQQTLLPILSLEPQELVWYAEDGTALYTAYDFTIEVQGEGFENLQASFRQNHPGIRESDHTLAIESAKEHYTEFSESFYEYSSSYTAGLTRLDNTLASLRIIYSDYSGGAHGMYFVFGETYDMQTGALLKLSDLVSDVEGFYPHAIDYINNALFQSYEEELYSDYQTQVENTFSPTNEPNWYLSSTGIVVTFTPYELGPYSMGAPEITLPYTVFAEYMQDKYLASVDELVAKVSANQDISFLIGTTEPIMIETIENEWYMLDINVIAGSTSSNVGSFSFMKDAYLIKRIDGRSFLIITGDYMSDDFATFVYEISDGTLRKCAELTFMHPSGGAITPTAIEMLVHLDVLGSYSSYTMYTIAPNGELIHSEDTFPIQSQYPLTTKLALPVILNGEETILDAGTQISIIGTNNVDEVYFNIVGTQQDGIIRYTRNADSWYLEINGVSEYDYFEMLPYAG